jgi:hypothetical protein
MRGMGHDELASRTCPRSRSGNGVHAGPRPTPASPAKRSGSVARCLPLASPVTAASRSCQNRSPVLWQHLPRYAAAEHEQNPGEASTIRQARSAALGSMRNELVLGRQMSVTHGHLDARQSTARPMPHRVAGALNSIPKCAISGPSWKHTRSLALSAHSRSLPIWVPRLGSATGAWSCALLISLVRPNSRVNKASMANGNFVAFAD